MSTDTALEVSDEARRRVVLPTGRLGRNHFKLFGANTISNLGDGIGIGIVAYPWLASAVTRPA